MIQVDFLDAHDAENDFARLFDTLKHRFIDFVIVVQKVDYESSWPFAYLKHKFCILGIQRNNFAVVAEMPCKLNFYPLVTEN
jgi:signal recognition particle receptor subunit beta